MNIKKLLILILPIYVIVFTNYPAIAQEDKTSEINSPKKTATATILPETIYLVDSSRSMWTRHDNTPRFEIIKQTFSKYYSGSNLISGGKNNITPGLIFFGSTKRNSCNDVQVIRKPNIKAETAIDEDIKELKPKGRSPLAQALKKVKTEFSPNSIKRNVIIIADGYDNCRKNACYEARGMAKNHNINVITIGQNKRDNNKLRCISKATKGMYFEVKSVAELENAINQINAASLATDMANITPVKSEQQEDHNNDKENDSTKNEILITDEDKFSIKYTPPQPNINPIWQEKLTSMVDKIGKEDNKKNQEKDNKSKKKKAKESKLNKKKKKFTDRVPSINEVKSSRKSAQQAVKKKITLKAKLTKQTDYIQRPVQWDIYRLDKDNKGLIKSINQSTPTIELLTGKYIINAKYGLANATQNIEINQKTNKNIELELNAGGIRINTVIDSIELPKEQSSISFIYDSKKDENGIPKFKTRILDSRQLVILKAGEYNVISKLGTANSVATTNIKIKPGILDNIEIVHKSGVVNLRTSTKNTSTNRLHKIVWKILDHKEQIVSKTTGPEPSLVLSPGNYSVIAEQGKKLFRKSFTILANEVKTVYIGL